MLFAQDDAVVISSSQDEGKEDSGTEGGVVIAGGKSTGDKHPKAVNMPCSSTESHSSGKGRGLTCSTDYPVVVSTDLVLVVPPLNVASQNLSSVAGTEHHTSVQFTTEPSNNLDLAEENTNLPCISSPTKTIRRGSFAGLLQTSSQSSGATRPDTMTFSSPSSSLMLSPSGPGKARTAVPMPLMSDDTMNDLFDQMRERGTQGCASISMGFLGVCNTSQDLSEAVQSTDTGFRDSNPADGVLQDERSSRERGEAPSCPASTTPSRSAGGSRDNNHIHKWTKEQDRVILEMVRDKGDNSDTYSEIATILQCVTSQQVAERVSTLLELLKSYSEETTESTDEDL
ncbi:uncharacterized protein LOC143297150 [Babylonia areolata]|uniref:uncharacterized protein LOC143297150 n=1 Tax=Babylonia areolata TaxID=304850 RepID=UPI003FD35DF7